MEKSFEIKGFSLRVRRCIWNISSARSKSAMFCRCKFGENAIKSVPKLKYLTILYLSYKVIGGIKEDVTDMMYAEWMKRRNVFRHNLW